MEIREWVGYDTVLDENSDLEQILCWYCVCILNMFGSLTIGVGG